ncbi:hypothetical protein HYT25_03850 [Candidatus Pacearchaeota archaeon]|nr:hypothetical protein [Candidatus Pacearchaeota archaeon]
MFAKKEVAHIVVAILVLSLAISIWNFEILFYALASVFFIVFANIVAKNISAYYFEAEIESKIWEIYRYGLLGVLSKSYFSVHPSRKFKKPVPIGAFLPIITSLVSLGYFTWFSALVFDVKPKSYRAAKRHGLYSFSEMTEEHIGYIAAFGILANLLFAIIGYFIGFELFAKLNIYYAFFNILPLSDLDGNKIFFGNIVLWSFLAALILIGMGYVFLIV